ncbi:MAG: aldehyde dehydrogenase family protein [Polyangiaceae bacterium]|jgi:acyl-CoA reductase-like NAD-dependent aldehyde dehydrogenase|nr:aldehyde dehydrogenase family protein [Polyangiaceae bacterium]
MHDDPAATTPTPVDALPNLLDKAHCAQRAWSAVPLGERVCALRPVARRALARAEQLASAVHRDTGKPIEEALLAEVLCFADVVEYWTQHIETFLDPTEVELDPLIFRGKRGCTHRVARGVIALITPWNYPLIIPARHLIPALLCGNAVAFKPSEVTPTINRQLAELFEGLLPAGLLLTLTGDAALGSALLQQNIDAVSFTGSTDAGREVAAACARRLVPCSLELGGNDAAIVLADAKLDRAARGIAWGAFTNAGQNCASIERAYVERAIAEPFLKELVAVTRTLRPGIDVARITTEAHARKTASQLENAVQSGARVLIGGAVEGDPRDLPPTILRIDNEQDALLREEIFAPILPVVVVDNEDDAVARANASPFGLTASVWTRRVSRGRSLARRLRAGVVTVNNHAFTAALPMAPWSGCGLSGYGVTNSHWALDGYTRPLFVLVDRSHSARELWWYPYNETLRRLAFAMARARGGAALLGRIAAFFALLVLLPKRMFSRG